VTDDSIHDSSSVRSLVASAFEYAVCSLHTVVVDWCHNNIRMRCHCSLHQKHHVTQTALHETRRGAGSHNRFAWLQTRRGHCRCHGLCRVVSATVSSTH
jgi:hypothetical protein